LENIRKTPRNVVVDEKSIKTMTLIENDSMVKHNDVSRSHDSSMETRILGQLAY